MAYDPDPDPNDPPPPPPPCEDNICEECPLGEESDECGLAEPT